MFIESNAMPHPAQPSTSDAKAHWATKAAAWDEWADPMQRMAEKFNEPLLEIADLATGHAVLDLASGVGEPAISAARIVGPTGFCCATDFVPEMLEGIQKREGTQDLLLTAADMQSLPFVDNTFDRVICRFGVMFAPNTDKLVAELQRVLKPEGRIALMVWGERHQQTLFQALSDAVEKTIDLMPDEHHYSIFRFGEEGSFSRHMTNSAFENIEESTHQFAARVSPEKPFWQAQLDMTFGHLLTSLDRDKLQMLDDAIQRELSKTRMDGKYKLESHIRIITAKLSY